MSWFAVVGTLVVGFVGGVLSGMFGVGGAVLTTPGIRVFGATPIEAVGSTVPAIIPSAVSGTVRYARAGIVNWHLGLTCGLTGALVAVGGATAADHVNGHLLMVFTAALLGWSGISTWRSGRRVVREPAAPEAVPSGEAPIRGADVGPSTAEVLGEGGTGAAGGRLRYPTGFLAVVGAGSGFLAGFLGVGGGVVMMPVFTSILKVPVKEAVASSLVAVALFSVPALVTHAVLGNIHWGYAALLAVGTIPGAQVGSRLTLGATDRTVRTLFGIFLVALALVYGISEIVAW